MVYKIKKHSHVLFLLFLFAIGLASWMHVRASVPATAIMTVSTTVNATCSIKSVSNLTFANYDPTNVTTDTTGQGSFNLQCTKNMTVTNIDISSGSNLATGKRQMKLSGGGATDVLPYNLNQPTGYVFSTGTGGTCPGTATLWGSGVTNGQALPAGRSPGGAGFSIPVCGTIPKGANVPAGAYTDQVTVTVNF